MTFMEFVFFGGLIATAALIGILVRRCNEKAMHELEQQNEWEDWH